MPDIRKTLMYSVGFGVFYFALNYYMFDYTFGRALFNTLFTTIFVGLIFHFVEPWMMKRMATGLLKSIPPLELLTGENIVMESAANHFRGMEAVGGRLTLTNHRLVFVAHKLNVQNRRTELDRNIIVEAKRHAKFSKGMVLKTNENVSHTFIVDSRDQWIAEVNGNSSPHT
ncbi:MAG TPA: hypothetical protein VGD65_09420 [Chryseosolibacter sp.]